MYIVSEETKTKMSKAKMGRKYNAEHKMNMRLTHILKYAREGDWCPVKRIMGEYKGMREYSEYDRNLLLKGLVRRRMELSDESRSLLDKYVVSDK